MIHILTKETIDKIAAGEVVERPESVVRELVDNAVDAGAKHVSVELREGGTQLIRVTDDGCGIAPEDVPRAFLRHATSKLESAEDLLSIRTMGFRGEALASISGVSQVELITRTRGSLLGTRYVIDGGREISLSEVGAPEGTSVVVRSLFYNVPARRKFLKSRRTEEALCLDFMEKAALAHPEIAMSLRADGRQLLSTVGSGKLRDVVYTVWGKETENALLPLDYTTGGVRISGFVTAAYLNFARRDREYFFVNRRSIQSKLLAGALEEGFSGRLMQHRFPGCFLFLDLEPSEVDVNVHPRKTEVRFGDEKAVYEAVQAAVKTALTASEVLQPFTGKETEEKSTAHVPYVYAKERPYTEASGVSEQRSEQRSETGPAFVPSSGFAAHAEPFETKKGDILRKEQLTLLEALGARKEEAPAFFQGGSLSSPRLVGQVFDTYWIFEYEGSLFLVDQHAAHEKVNYERFMKELSEGVPASQNLLMPVRLTLSPVRTELLLQNLSVFTELGYEIEHMGGRDFLVRAVPQTVCGIADKDLLTEMIESLSFEKQGADSGTLKRAIATMSCKASVKGGQRISAGEMEHLFREMLTLENPYHCPHGRPTVIRWSRAEIEKLFRRIV